MAYPGVPAVGMGAMGAVPQAPQQQREKFDSAIEFLERVKVVYADQPVVYNQFLDIMKGFKTHTIDTTGVIKRVKQLFKGHPELTRGFAAFLPKEYKIDVKEDDDDDMVDGGGVGAPGGHVGGGMMPVSQQQLLAQQQQQQHAAAVQAQAAAAAAAAAAVAAQQQGGGGGAGGAGGVEVGEEHARLYVKKIKNRFVNQPQTYKNFLEILHTFHREKHSIQEVYQQVAVLFRDHPDLLAEFAHFLPDHNAQAQGMPVSAAQQAAAAAHQQHFAQPGQHHHHHHHHHEDHHAITGGAGAGVHQSHKQSQRGAARGASRAGVLTEPASRAPSRSHTQSAMAGSSMQHAIGGGRSLPGNIGSAASSRGGSGAGAMAAPPPLHSSLGVDGMSKERSHGTFEELMHFFKLKQVLPQNDYEEFLKLLAMYNADVLSKSELYYMVRDMLRHQDMELLDWFRKFMQLEDLKDDESHGFLADYDWSTSEKLGPSYRSTPKHWSQWKCSGRQGNSLCTEVLNDNWISVPTGTEEGAFKNSRKNQYEELLFKCEDDRFELDLLVEGNASAIRALELTLASFRTLSPSALSTFQLNENDISTITIKAIRRVYGPRAEEFIKMIMGKPAVAIPIVLARLKAKDTEWNIARREWNVLWKQIFKKNYHKQLDHRSTAFKQEEKKMLTAKALFAELRRASTEQKPTTQSQQGTTTGAEKSDAETSSSSNANKMDEDVIKVGPTNASGASSSMGASEDVVASIASVSGVNVNASSSESAMNANGASSSSSSSTSSATVASQSAVGSPTLSFIIAQPNLFADIRHLLLTTFATQFTKADVDKFNTLWNSLICAFFHVDPSLKSVIADLPSFSSSSSSSATTTTTTTTGDSANKSEGGSMMDVDAGSSSNAAANVANATSSSSDSSGDQASSSASTTSASTTSNMMMIAPGMSSSATTAPNKPISTEMASKPSTHHMLFLGNDSFYLLFRYLQILYDRIAEAWLFSEEFPQIHNPPIVEIDPKQPLSEMPVAAIALSASAALSLGTTVPVPGPTTTTTTTNTTTTSSSGDASVSANSMTSMGEKQAADDGEPSSTAEPQVIIYSDPNPPMFLDTS